MSKDKKQKKTGRIKSFFSDFKDFINKGNILDLAVAVIIGGAFGKIVTSLVNDIIMPLITLLANGKSVADWKKVITPAVHDANGVETVAESAIRYGIFIQSVLDFLIIALFIFLAIRICMRLKKLATIKQKEEESLAEAAVEVVAEAEAKAEVPANLSSEGNAHDTAVLDGKPVLVEQLLTEIRDLLKNKEENV